MPALRTTTPVILIRPHLHRTHRQHPAWRPVVPGVARTAGTSSVDAQWVVVRGGGAPVAVDEARLAAGAPVGKGHHAAAAAAAAVMGAGWLLLVMQQGVQGLHRGGLRWVQLTVCERLACQRVLCWRHRSIDDLLDGKQEALWMSCTQSQEQQQWCSSLCRWRQRGLPACIAAQVFVWQ